MYYGPKERGYIDYSNSYTNAKNKFEVEMMHKNDLKKQIMEKRRILNAQKHKERLEDVENLWIAGKVMKKEREKREKEKQAKNVYKELWNEQMKINKLRDIIRSEGGEKITS